MNKRRTGRTTAMVNDSIDAATMRDNTTEEKKTCTWTEARSHEWSTSCGEKKYIFGNKGPLGGGYKFCPYCGKAIVEDRYIVPEAFVPLADRIVAQLKALKRYDMAKIWWGDEITVGTIQCRSGEFVKWKDIGAIIANIGTEHA